MIKWCFIRLILDLIVVRCVVGAYHVGADLFQELSGFHYFPVAIVGGATACAAIFFFLNKVKEFIFFFIKSGTIWSICHPEDTDIIRIIGKVTGNYKETLSIPLINFGVRKLFVQLRNVILESDIELPEALKGFNDVPGFRTVFKHFKHVLDYADECVLAWCYAHDDTLLDECTTGFLVFVKNAGELMMRIIPTVLLNAIIRIFVIISTIWLVILYRGVSWSSVMSIYLLVLSVDYVFRDVVLEPVFMQSIIKCYAKHFDDETDNLSDLQNELSGIVDFSEIRNVGVFKNDKETDGENGNTGDV